MIILFYVFIILMQFVPVYLFKKQTFFRSLFALKGYLFLYSTLVVFSILSYDFTNYNVYEEVVTKYGLHHHTSWFYQIVTSNFIHAGLSHLFFNLLFLTLLSFLEIEYGYILLLGIFTIPSIIASTLLMFIIPDDTILIGSSIGLSALFGMMIAEDILCSTLPIKNSISSKVMNYILGIVVIMVFSLLGGSKRSGANEYTIIGHILGGVLGYIIYTLIKYKTPTVYKTLLFQGLRNAA